MKYFNLVLIVAKYCAYSICGVMVYIFLRAFCGRAGVGSFGSSPISKWSNDVIVITDVHLVML